MAKRKPQPKQDDTQEMPVAKVKPTPLVLPPDSELTHIINVDTGEIRQVFTRAGYAPAPMPFGFRLAKANELPVDDAGKE